MTNTKHSGTSGATLGLFVTFNNGVIKEIFTSPEDFALFKAAPELLEALKAVAFMDVNGHQLIDRLSFSTPGREIQDKILKAIARAEGKEGGE